MNNTFNYDFSRVAGAESLSIFLGTTNDLLIKAALSENRNLFYTQHKIPKHGKNSKDKYRLVWEIVNENLLQAHKNFTRRFGVFVSSQQYIHEAAFGYVKQIGTPENASVHGGASLLLRADISNFFPSISSEKIVEGFKKLHLNKDIIEILIGFLTLDKRLPLGFPASPMLANIVCKELDQKISDLASKYECKYTRYADDISISGNTKLPAKEELAEIICKENFRLCESKFRITKIGQAHYVTGLSISDNKMPHAPKSLKKKLRQQLYYCKKFGIKNHLIKTTGEDFAMQSGINRIHGMICYISHIEKKPILLQEWRDLLARDKCTIKYTSYRYSLPLALSTKLVDDTKDQAPKGIVFYVDETEICIKSMNKTYLAIAFTAIESDKVKDIAIDIETMLDNYLANPFTGSDKNKLKQNKLHFADADRELKGECIKYLCTTNLKTYLAYGSLNESKKPQYQKLYINLISKIMKLVLSKKIYDGLTMIFNFEQNNKVDLKEIKNTLNRCLENLEFHNSKRPGALSKVSFVAKNEEYPLTAPDFMLGVFNQYITADRTRNNGSPVFEDRMFEELRDMYTLILNTDNNIRFTRKNPFKVSPSKENV